MIKKTVISVLLITLALFAFAGGKKEAPVAMMVAEDTTQKPVFETKGLGPSVYAFSNLAEAKKLAAKGPTVLFFAASWCPTCRATYKDIVANYVQLPANFSLILVNYDTAKAEKSQYGVTYQHTFVRIDKEGKASKTWSGSPSVVDILAQAGVK